MFEYVAKNLIVSGISIAKDILANRIKDKNKQLLEKKKKAAKKKLLSSKDIASLTLSPAEELSGNIVISEDETYTALSQHVNSIKDWSQHIGFNDLRGKKNVNDIYIELDTYLTPLRSHLDSIEKSQTKPLTNAIYSSRSHSIILGQPGAGKTTSMKKLCSSFFNSTNDFSQLYSIPILIRLREIKANQSRKQVLFNELSEIISIKFKLKNQKDSSNQSLSNFALLSFINELKPLVILDGFDEIASNELQKVIVEELRLLSRSLTTAKVVLTCRSGEFNYSIDGAEVFEIAPLNENQIASFANKWIENVSDAKKFLNDVRNSPFSDTAIKPLSLAHLCAIYERIGKIPDRPKTVYRKIVSLLLEEWDEQRSVKRQSLYAKFEADRKFEFLSHLAYYFTTNTRSTVFGKEQFALAYRSICKNFNLEPDQESLVVAELESHTGLFIQTGYEKYEFVHKSLQEFLAGEYIVKLPSVPKDSRVLESLANELAIAISISSNPSIYFTELVINRLGVAKLPNSFYDAFVNRLIIEKPDFYEYDELIFAMHLLLSLWVCEGKITARKIHIRSINTASLEQFLTFEAILDSSITRDAMAAYYYLSREELVYVGETVMYKVGRRKQHAEYKLPTYLLMLN